jgi:hypothetical protein
MAQALAARDRIPNFILQKYFENADINVFWGSSAQFIAELREHWEARR